MKNNMKKLSLIITVLGISSQFSGNLHANAWADCVEECMNECIVSALMYSQADIVDATELCGLECDTQCKAEEKNDTKNNNGTSAI